MGNIIERIVSRAVDGVINERIEAHIARVLARETDAQLTEVGFGLAFYLALREIWPGVDRRTAVAWARDYIGVPFCSPGYDWSPRAAKELATAYAQDFGE